MDEVMRLARRLDAFLGAQRYAPGAGPGIQTFSTQMENVFVKYYEWKSNRADAENVYWGYTDDWGQFLLYLHVNTRKKQPFVGICPVLYLKTGIEEGYMVVEDFLVRPCALGFDFLKDLLKTLASACLESNLSLKIRIKAARATPIEPLLSVNGRSIRVYKQEDLTHPSTVYEIDSDALHLFTNTRIRLPESNELNLFNNDAIQDTHMQRMYENLAPKARGRMEIVSGHTTDLPSSIGITDAVAAQLVVYKGGYRYRFSDKTVLADEAEMKRPASSARRAHEPEKNAPDTAEHESFNSDAADSFTYVEDFQPIDNTTIKKFPLVLQYTENFKYHVEEQFGKPEREGEPAGYDGQLGITQIIVKVTYTIDSQNHILEIKTKNGHVFGRRDQSTAEGMPLDLMHSGHFKYVRNGLEFITAETTTPRHSFVLLETPARFNYKARPNPATGLGPWDGEYEQQHI